MEEQKTNQETTPRDESKRRSLRERLINASHSKHGFRILYLISFLDSIFFPIPPDVIMIPMVAAKPGIWKKVAFWATVYSVLGAIVAYLIGVLFFDTVGMWILETYNLTEQMQTVGKFFEETAFLSFLVVSFTPLPDKLFNIAGGFLRINLPVILLAIFIGRLIRFSIVGYISHLGGKIRIWEYLKRFKKLTWFIVVLFVLILVYWFLIR